MARTWSPVTVSCQFRAASGCRPQASHVAIAGRRVRHRASACPIGVAEPWVKGHISSEMARQSAVADSSPSTANSPKLMRLLDAKLISRYGVPPSQHR